MFVFVWSNFEEQNKRHIYLFNSDTVSNTLDSNTRIECSRMSDSCKMILIVKVVQPQALAYLC